MFVYLPNCFISETYYQHLIIPIIYGLMQGCSSTNQIIHATSSDFYNAYFFLKFLERCSPYLIFQGWASKPASPLPI